MHLAAKAIDHLELVEPAIERLNAIDRGGLLERAAATLSSQPRPFIRWAGSKQRLLSQIVEHLPSTYGRYYEPFFGAGALFFLLRPGRATLNDLCLPLVETYQTSARSPGAVLSALEPLDVMNKELYYRLRSSTPIDDVERAAQFIYLNRAAWNGLYRVNGKGQFNVPYGMPKSPNIVDEANYRSASALLQQPGVSMQHGDFEDAIANADSGDLVFFDPPYASSKRREGFVDYNEKLFTWDDQRRLADVAERLRQKGVKVIVTNAYNTAIGELYPRFNHHALIRRSSLASNKDLRRSVAESLFVS
ncbi:Dam family site-specific DNA-(adenine-N6)-methyltransferase [Curtobacterium flaccumfaciens]|nr:Dam family site-specific DNA-(adenine-N6)-methyltransferase [Curtobacterium flaccumfaciens]